MKPNNPAGEISSWINSAEPSRVFAMEPLLRAKMQHLQFPTPTYEPVFCFPLLTPWACLKLIEAAVEADAWAAPPGDPYPGDEVKLSDISLQLDHSFKLAFCYMANTYLAERYVKYRIAPHTIESAFIIRYRAGQGVQELGVHHDGQSEITFSIPLNDEFEGSGLFFALAPGLPDGWLGNAGDCLCFPGGPTHEHYVKSITEGERYSLTIWTKGV